MSEHDDYYEPHHASSPTDHVLSELQLYGYRPFTDEPNPRPLPEGDHVAGAIADIFDDPQFQARGDLTAVTLPGLGEVVVPSPLPKLSETPAQITSLGPGLGEHNEDVYGRLLGLSAEQLGKLRKDGVI